MFTGSIHGWMGVGGWGGVLHCFFFIAATGVGVGGGGACSRYSYVQYFTFLRRTLYSFHGRKIAKITEESKMARDGT
jgi:hypothetical protein